MSQSVDSQTGGYTPTPEEQAVLLAIPRDFLKFGALGFAGGSIATHIGLKSTYVTKFYHLDTLNCSLEMEKCDLNFGSTFLTIFCASCESGDSAHGRFG